VLSNFLINRKESNKHQRGSMREIILIEM